MFSKSLDPTWNLEPKREPLIIVFKPELEPNPTA